MKIVDIIKEKIDIVEFIRSYIPLQPAGKNFKAFCPFHQEKTPSFIVSPERKIWHCFGACADGGDVIKFVMRYEHLEFYEAIKFLAGKIGVPFEGISSREEREFNILYALHETAKDFFKKELFKNKEALEYLKRRGLKNETIDEFELGFAPGGESLVLYLLKSGYDINDINRAGLASKNRQGLYRDRFDRRVIFPLFNSVGKAVAFVGRLLDETKSDMPKYLNSPETLIFNKSKILYGFHKSKNEIHQKKSVFMVEGQMDFLMSWQTGIKNAVAVSGTGLSSFHLEKLRRLAEVVFLGFDNDEAGLKSLERSIDIFHSFDFHLKAVDLGQFKDPAEAAFSDQKFLLNAVEKAKPAMRHLFDYYFADSTKDITFKKKAVRYFLLKIKKLKSAAERDFWLKDLGKTAKISETILLGEFNELNDEEKIVSRDNNLAGKQQDRIDIISQRLIILAFTKMQFFDIIKENQAYLPESYRDILTDSQSEKSVFFQMQASLLVDYDEKKLLWECKELLKNLQIEFLQKQQQALRQEIGLAEERGDDSETMKLVDKINTLAKKINELKLSQ